MALRRRRSHLGGQRHRPLPAVQPAEPGGGGGAVRAAAQPAALVAPAALAPTTAHGAAAAQPGAATAHTDRLPATSDKSAAPTRALPSPPPPVEGGASTPPPPQGQPGSPVPPGGNQPPPPPPSVEQVRSRADVQVPPATEDAQAAQFVCAYHLPWRARAAYSSLQEQRSLDSSKEGLLPPLQVTVTVPVVSFTARLAIYSPVTFDHLAQQAYIAALQAASSVGERVHWAGPKRREAGRGDGVFTLGAACTAALQCSERCPRICGQQPATVPAILPSSSPMPPSRAVKVHVELSNIRAGSAIVVRGHVDLPAPWLQLCTHTRTRARAHTHKGCTLETPHCTAARSANGAFLVCPFPRQDTSVQFLVGNGDTGAADSLAAALSSDPGSVLPPGTWGSVTVTGVQQVRWVEGDRPCGGGAAPAMDRSPGAALCPLAFRCDSHASASPGGGPHSSPPHMRAVGGHHHSACQRPLLPVWRLQDALCTHRRPGRRW